MSTAGSNDPRTHDFKPLTGVEFKPWPKIARLNRDIIITEKIDGTNAAIGITEDREVYAQSRTRIITPEKDNFGFARWVHDNAQALFTALGPGIHFGEWYGLGIQRGYGLTERRFALFNTTRYEHWPFTALGLPSVNIVPKLYEGPYDQTMIDACLDVLRENGSAVGSGPAEGIVVFHTAAGMMFKVTLEGDGEPKSVRVARESVTA